MVRTTEARPSWVSKLSFILILLGLALLVAAQLFAAPASLGGFYLSTAGAMMAGGPIGLAIGLCRGTAERYVGVRLMR